MDSQVNVVEVNGEKYIKLSTYTKSVKIHASCEKAYQQLSLVQAALAKTSQYVAQRQQEVNKVIEDFCHEMGYKPNGFAIIQGSLASQQSPPDVLQSTAVNLKRERRNSDELNRTPKPMEKRIKDEAVSNVTSPVDIVVTGHNIVNGCKTTYGEAASPLPQLDVETVVGSQQL